MVNKKQKLVTANGKAIYNLRTEANLKQKQLVDVAKKMKVSIPLRSYQRAEAGEKVNKDLLEKIAVFFDRYLPTQGWHGSTNIADIVIFDENFSSSNFSISRIKDHNDFQTEHAYLWSMSNFNDLERIVKASTMKKIFYEFTPTNTQKLAIKDALHGIKRIKENSNKKNEKTFSSYSKFDEELKRLEEITENTSFLDRLSDAGVQLFAGNFYLKYIKAQIIDNENKRPEYFGDSHSPHDVGDWEPSIGFMNYGIFVFYPKTQKIRQMHMYYTNNWYGAKLDALTKDPYKIIEKNIIDWEADDRIARHYDMLCGYDYDLVDNNAEFKIKIKDDYGDDFDFNESDSEEEQMY